MRGTDARRRERNSPEGILHGFHVSLYKVDPRICVFARNLLSKDDCRLALADEPMEVRPEVPLVIKPTSRACRAERLARTGTSPNRSIIGPAGAAKGVGPSADAGEEMALGVGLEVIWVNILDRSFVNVAWRDVACGNQIADPLRGVWVDFVVIRSHATPFYDWRRLDKWVITALRHDLAEAAMALKSDTDALALIAEEADVMLEKIGLPNDHLQKELAIGLRQIVALARYRAGSGIGDDDPRRGGVIVE